MLQRMLSDEVLRRWGGALNSMTALLRSLLASATLLLAAPASGQELMALTDWLEQPADDQEPSYILVRCAALYAGILFYLGDGAEATLGVDGVSIYEGYFSDLGTMAVLVRADLANLPRGSQVVADSVLEDENQISQLYEERMHSNYRTTGQAFGSDLLILGDMEICAAVTKNVAAQLDSVRLNE
jgi:hypothetical protein